MNRKEARTLVMQCIFQTEVQPEGGLSPLDLLEKDQTISADIRDYLVETYETYLKHRDDIDEAINEAADKWDVRHLPKAELAILRLGVTEMNYRDDIPQAVAINEAVELAKRFGEPKGASFVNGVLGKVAKQ